MYWPGEAGWHMGGMAFWWILGIAVLAVVLWALLRGAPARGVDDGGGNSPEAILKRRYASGEIDRETYERMLADLRR